MNDDFFMELVKQLKAALGDSYDFIQNEVERNNGVMKESICIWKCGMTSAPVIEIESHRKAYLAGKGMKEIVTEILYAYYQELQASAPNFKMEGLDWELAQNKIVCRLINYEKNHKRLSELPHIRFLDLAVTFHFLAANMPDQIASIQVTRQLLTFWGKNTAILWEIARENTKRLFPMQSKPVEAVVQELAVLLDGKSLDLEMGSSGMYVLTNSKGSFGASVLLYEDAKEQFEALCSGDYYLLPSSIHEIILVPKNTKNEIQALTSYVQEMNRTQLLPEEVLSEHIYRYNQQKQMFEF